MREPIIPVEAEFTLLKKDLVKVRRRSAIRYRCNLATLGYLFFPASGESLEAWAHNLSETGIGLNLARPLPIATPVVIRLNPADGASPITLSALVVHTTREVDGSWRIGCQFAGRLSPEALDALL